MQLKSTILSGLGLRTLKRIVDALEIDVDRRSVEAMRAVLSRSRKVTAEDLLGHMRKDEMKTVCEGVGLSGNGRRDELLERLRSVQNSITQGLDDGTRIKSYKKGWSVVDRHGLFLADPKSATWVISRHDKEMPPAVFPTAAAAYMAWMQSQEVAKGRKQQQPDVLGQRVSGGSTE
jgi:hypothetical protein